MVEHLKSDFPVSVRLSEKNRKRFAFNIYRLALIASQLKRIFRKGVRGIPVNMAVDKPETEQFSLSGVEETLPVFSDRFTPSDGSVTSGS